MHKLTARCVLTLCSALTIGAGVTRAQTAPGEPASTRLNKEAGDDDVIVLSPFVVSSAEDKGYKANSTLAGSRVRTELRDLASSLSVVTSQFLQDTGATNNESLLLYTTNTEVAGIYGNMAGVGSTYMEGATESATNLLRPATNTRVRGLDSADNTRDYFQTDIPWDSFNIGRVDLQRGPNSILFGIGSPAGIINTSVNTAGYKTEGKVENRIGSFGSVRDSFDYNYVVIPEQLAVRVAGIYDDTKYRQQPAYNWDRRLFGAVRWDPKLFQNGRTTIRANYENGNVKANRPRSLPPIDRLTPYFDPNGFNKQLQDATYTTQMGIQPFSSSSLYPGEKANFWFGGSMGTGGGASPVFTFDNASTPTSVHAGVPGTYFAIGKDGKRSGSIGGFPYAQQVGIAGYGTYSINVDKYGAARGATAEQLAAAAGASEGFFKDKSITDTGIYDFYNNLLDGNTKKEWQNWETYNLSLEQTFFGDRVGFQAVYDRQHYNDGSESNLGYSTYLSVDINAYTYEYPGAYNTANGYSGEVSAKKNPNAGRVYTGGTGTTGSRSTDRENVRLTGFGEFRAKDFFSNSLLTKIIGHHTVTGVYSEERYDVEDRSWTRYAATNAWNDLIGKGPDFDQGGNGGLASGALTVNTLTYLTGSVAGYANASQLNIPRITTDQSPSGSYSAKYYDSHWKWSLDPSAPDYVDPNASWTNPTYRPDNTGTDTQSSNPANYVGWKDTTVTILNADKGDINSLYTSASKNQRKTTSKGITWQAYLWDDTLVGTFGWRRDTQKIRSGAAVSDGYGTPYDTGVVKMDYGLDPLDPDTGITTGESKSWGLVLHTPRKLRDKLPWGSDISLGFSDGNNSRVENRYGFDASKLANAKGHSRDYSIVVSTLNDRLTFKATYYDTKVKDANISSVTTATSTLGANTNQLVENEAYGTASALMDLAGMAGQYDQNWYWNWTYYAHNSESAYEDPSTDLYKNDPVTIKQKESIASWLDQMQSQKWFDAFGYKINVEKAKAGDWAHAINDGGWQPSNYVNNLGANNGGKVNGQWPTGTVDYESKGWEFEITGQPTKNWNVSLNASKQTAQQTALGANLVATIEALHTKYASPAGDLRRWWGGDESMRDVFNRDIYSAYLFQKDTNGKMVSEMAPWRFNLVSNYSFDRGLLKGFNIGGGYRWEDRKILGYALNEDQDNLDVNKPYWSPSQDSVDLWAGYQRKLTPKIQWRIQLNLRNVGEQPHLTPISVEPDGSYAQFRIEEGMTWTLTNTFSF